MQATGTFAATFLLPDFRLSAAHSPTVLLPAAHLPIVLLPAVHLPAALLLLLLQTSYECILIEK